MLISLFFWFTIAIIDFFLAGVPLAYAIGGLSNGDADTAQLSILVMLFVLFYLNGLSALESAESAMRNQ